MPSKWGHKLDTRLYSKIIMGQSTFIPSKGQKFNEFQQIREAFRHIFSYKKDWNFSFISKTWSMLGYAQLMKAH